MEDEIMLYENMVKLDLDDDTRRRAANIINDLRKGFNKLGGIDTHGIEPLVTVLDLKNVLRDDIPQKGFTREQLLQNAPSEYGGYFEVPRTLE